MSQDENLQSNSESSGSSTSNYFPFSHDYIENNSDSNSTVDKNSESTSTPTLARSGTVKRVGSFPQKKEHHHSASEDSDIVFVRDKSCSDRLLFKRSIENNAFRRSLESISEYKTKNSFSPTRTLSTTSRCSSSLESFSSEPEPIKTAKSTNREVQSPASSYLSWIESVSVSNEFISAPIAPTDVKNDINNDIDTKVGEWNNFWLNYNTARGRYMSSAFLSADDQMSEAKSSSNSNPRDSLNRRSEEFVCLTLDEVHEAMKCSKKLTEIFHAALARNERDCENSNFETSYYSESISRQNSSIKEEPNVFTPEDLRKVSRERSASYIVTTQDLLKKKELIKPTAQSSSTSCINAILNSGVGDILKRVMKRRDIMTPDDLSSMTRRSFSEWSGK